KPPAVLADDIARFRSDDQSGALYLNPDLLAVAGIARVRRVVSERILPSELFRDTRECGIKIIERVRLKRTAAAVSGQRFQIILTSGIFTRARAGAAASTAHRDSAAAEDHAKETAPSAARS